MLLWKSFAGKVGRLGFAFCRYLVARPKGRRLLIRSGLVAVFGGAVFAWVAFAGFITAPTYSVGIVPISVAVGDFNGDGIPDLAVANLTNVFGATGTVSILLGNGDGTFQAAQNYPVGTQPRSVVVGDFNGDGYLDLAVAHSNSADQPVVSVLLGNGDGTFGAPQIEAVGSGQFLAVADFNGDGHLDLTAFSNGMVSVLLGDGDGTFQTSHTYAVGNSPSSLAIGNFTGNGTSDIVVANFGSDTVSVLLGNGDGTFQAAHDYAVGLEPTAVVVGDFNGDGIADIVANSASGVAILLGKGDGTFQAARNHPVRDGAFTMAVGDFNGDGHLDLATTSNVGVSILLGKGDGTFSDALRYAAGSVPRAVAVRDFNRDGRLDLAVTNGDWLHAGSVSILLGKGDGTFQAARGYSVSGGSRFVAVGDFDGDGIPDLGVAADGPVNILLGNGDGSFRAGSTFDAGVGTIGTSCVAVGDFNGDGRQDIVTTNFIGPSRNHPFPYINELRVFLGNGDGTFQSPVVYQMELGSGFVAVADFNGDGILDLAVANRGWNGIFPVHSVSILLGNGDGTFQAPQGYAAGPTAWSLAVGDFNGDGHLDLVVAGDPGLRVLLGNGDGTFQEAKSYAGGGLSVVVGDFNGDGIPDLAAADGSNVSVLLGNGDGTFQAAREFPAGSALWMAVGDFNHDGILDLAVAGGQSDSTVSVLLGNGDGTFQAARSYAAGTAPGSMVVGDFHGDGLGFPDLAVINTWYDTVTVLLNDTTWPP